MFRTFLRSIGSAATSPTLLGCTGRLLHRQLLQEQFSSEDRSSRKVCIWLLCLPMPFRGMYTPYQEVCLERKSILFWTCNFSKCKQKQSQRSTCRMTWNFMDLNYTWYFTLKLHFFYRNSLKTCAKVLKEYLILYPTMLHSVYWSLQVVLMCNTRNSSHFYREWCGHLRKLLWNTFMISSYFK